MYSAKDALFTFHFFKLLCKLRVPNFNILYVLSAILKWIVPVMHCCSEDEAESLGIFFSELFKLLNYWCKVEDFSEKIVENFGKRFA
jgi:hypothetical protein